MLDESTSCYRHPQTKAAVECQRCGRPICPQCMSQASVGHHCPECVAGQGQQVHTARTLLDQRPPVTTALIVANVVAFVFQLGTNGVLTRWGLLFGPAIEIGEWWRVVTGGFLHAGLLHIGFNMYALWIFGPMLEKGIGTVRFALIYLAGLFGSSLAVLLFDFNQQTLGASGAVLGLAGGLAAVLMARGVNIFQTSLGAIFLINLALPLLVPRISFWGHFGGIIGGFLAGLAVTWLPERAGASDRAATAVATALTAGLFTAALFIGQNGALAFG